MSAFKNPFRTRYKIVYDKRNNIHELKMRFWWWPWYEHLYNVYTSDVNVAIDLLKEIQERMKLKRYFVVYRE